MEAELASDNGASALFGGSGARATFRLRNGMAIPCMPSRWLGAGAADYVKTVLIGTLNGAQVDSQYEKST